MSRKFHKAWPLLSRRYEPPWLTDAVFCLSVAQTSFTDCRDYFGSNDRLEKKKFLDLKTDTEKFISSK